MKKLFLALIVIGIMAWPGQAFAKPKPAMDFNQFRMVNTLKAESYGKGNPNALKTFGWAQSIYAFVKIHSSLPTTTNVTFKWIAPDLSSGFSSLSSFPKNKKGRSSFADNGMERQSGLWTVEASFVNQAGNTITKSRQFKIADNPNPEPLQQGLMTLRTTSQPIVTPEPMALILYGLGGLPIAAHLLRRRKTAA